MKDNKSEKPSCIIFFYSRIFDLTVIFKVIENYNLAFHSYQFFNLSRNQFYHSYVLVFLKPYSNKSFAYKYINSKMQQEKMFIIIVFQYILKEKRTSIQKSRPKLTGFKILQL